MPADKVFAFFDGTYIVINARIVLNDSALANFERYTQEVKEYIASVGNTLDGNHERS